VIRTKSYLGMTRGSYGNYVIVSELTNQGRHGSDIVVHPTQQDSLVAYRDACLRNPRDLVRVVEVRVQRHRFSNGLTLVGDRYESAGPLIVRIQYTTGRHRQAFGGKTKAADVGHGDQALPDHVELVRLEVIGVPARDHNVMKAILALNV
jgi:hypothetical protein